MVLQKLQLVIQLGLRITIVVFKCIENAYINLIDMSLRITIVVFKYMLQ